MYDCSKKRNLRISNLKISLGLSLNSKLVIWDCPARNVHAGYKAVAIMRKFCRFGPLAQNLREIYATAWHMIRLKKLARPFDNILLLQGTYNTKYMLDNIHISCIIQTALLSACVYKQKSLVFKRVKLVSVLFAYERMYSFLDISASLHCNTCTYKCDKMVCTLHYKYTVSYVTNVNNYRKNNKKENAIFSRGIIMRNFKNLSWNNFCPCWWLYSVEGISLRCFSFVEYTDQEYTCLRVLSAMLASLSY